MNRLRVCFSSAAIALVTAWSGAALADVAPPDECNGTAGTPCSNAGPSANQSGTCVSTTCPHTGPGPDGGVVTTQNPCVLCEVQSSGSSSGGGSTSSSGSSSGGSGGCAVGVTPREGAGAMLLVGVGLLLASRRRRRD
jgi:MYXO-CTERM domain-containing protein